MATKTSQTLTHAKQRFWLRYEVKLTDEVYRQIVNDIQNGRTRLVTSLSNGAVHDVCVKGIHIPVVYRNKQIITALPDYCLDAARVGVFIDC